MGTFNEPDLLVPVERPPRVPVKTINRGVAVPRIGLCHKKRVKRVLPKTGPTISRRTRPKVLRMQKLPRVWELPKA